MSSYVRLLAAAAILVSMSACFSSRQGTRAEQGVRIVKDEGAKKIDVMVDGSLFTSYRWPDSVFKPVLYPLVNAAGTEITRGYPLNPRPGERVDHPHHVGMWFNYGNVNGIDFWGNSYDIPAETRAKTGGTIKYLRSEAIRQGSGKASLTVYNSWQDPAGKELLYEKTTFDFISQDSVRIIDRITELTATTGAVDLPDTKEGMFAIRVARQLELPSKEAVTLTDANNNATTVPQMSNEGVTGNYTSSEGASGDSVWGKRARWMSLSGVIGADSTAIVIIDHPKNPGHPTHWHARGYGLFSVNPLGIKDFTQGTHAMNLSIAPNKSTTFRYRVVITAHKHPTPDEINKIADEFAKKY